MSTVVFDAQIALDARKAGVPEDQARAHVRVLTDALDQGLATKSDISDVKADIRELCAEVVVMRAGLNGKVTALQWRMTALIIGANGVLGLLLRFGRYT